MNTVIVRDETAAGREIAQMPLPDLPERITVREIVRLRVREEVARFNSRPSQHFSGLVQPTDAEATANGYLLRTPRRIDWERQADHAEEAFARNGFFILVGDRQVESLDEIVDLSAGDVTLSFIKLVPLVGG